MRSFRMGNPEMHPKFLSILSVQRKIHVRLEICKLISYNDTQKVSDTPSPVETDAGVSISQSSRSASYSTIHQF